MSQDGWTTPPVVAAADESALIAAVAAEALPLDLSEPVLRGDGWENVVLETRDGWIIRFPRAESLPFAREVAILERLAGRLPAAVPVVAYVGARTRFAAYRKLDGAAFDRTAYLAATPRERDALASSLAGFLAAMHSCLTPVEVAEIGIPPIDPGRDRSIVAASLDTLPREHRSTVASLVERHERMWAPGRVPGPTVVLHNDFHTGNMVFEPDRAVGRLVGIWDFSCVAVGEPTFDLRYVGDSPRDLLDRLADHYARLTGRAVDVTAAIVAGRIENVADAVEVAQPAMLEAALAGWAATDSGR